MVVSLIIRSGCCCCCFCLANGAYPSLHAQKQLKKKKEKRKKKKKKRSCAQAIICKQLSLRVDLAKIPHTQHLSKTGRSVSQC